jgi:hypothetical protein
MQKASPLDSGLSSSEIIAIIIFLAKAIEHLGRRQSVPDKPCELNRSMQHHLISRSENTSSWSTALSGCTQSDPSQDGVPFESKLANDF